MTSAPAAAAGPPAVPPTPADLVDRARRAAAAESTAVLWRCWLRESAQAVRGTGPVRVDLPATGRTVVVEVTRRSPTGAHGIGAVRDEAGHLLGPAEAAGLLCAEATAAAGRPPATAEPAARRVRESARRMADYAAARAADPTDPAGLPAWLAAEQGLIGGHPWHPMTKSHDDLPDTEDARYAPEARGCLELHWFAADPDVVVAGSVGGRDRALEWLRELAGPEIQVPPGLVALPAHPWQAARLAERPGAAALLEAGLLRPLGPAGGRWWATSSLRTLARPDRPGMLKTSLGLRVTNSRRENLRSECLLAVRTAELLDAGLAAELTARHPSFRVVADRAFVGADSPAGPIGLDTLLREQPFLDGDRVACAGALVDARPDRGRPPAADLVRALAARRGESVETTAALWFRRWLDVVAEPLLWLHGRFGVGLEAHLQNVLVGLDADGMPDRGFYRDSQGWYVAAGHAEAVERLLPGVCEGVALRFDDDLVTDRVVYYLGVNHLFGVAAALAGAGLAAEEDLLRVLRDALRAHARGPAPSPAADLLLTADTLAVKANLLTGIDGRDELDGDVATQSVYVAVPNPLREIR